jgi:hypothetical protein
VKSFCPGCRNLEFEKNNFLDKKRIQFCDFEKNNFADNKRIQLCEFEKNNFTDKKRIQEDRIFNRAKNSATIKIIIISVSFD